MRRSNREITDVGAIERFIAKQHIIRIGLYDNGEIYIVPVNYGYEYRNGVFTFYFHGARAGRKYGLAKANPCVGFEIDGEYRPLLSDNPCACSACFQSVIGSGRLSLVDGNEDKIKGLDRIMYQLTGKSEHTYSKEMLASVAVFRLEATQLSCKAKLG